MNSSIFIKKLRVPTIINHVIKRDLGRKVKPGCECPEKPVVEKFVMEKECLPCSFFNWKPKPRECIEETVKEDMRPKKPRKCYAGMVVKRPQSTCSPAAFDPFKKKMCLPKQQPLPEPPAKKPQEEPLPQADWDVNCQK